LEAPGAQPAASPAAPEPTLSPVDQAVASGDQAAFKEARRAERSGTVSADKPAASAPASPEVPAASTDASPSAASEPAKGSKVKTRTAELDTEIAALQERLRIRATLRDELARTSTPKPDDPPASSATAPAKKTYDGKKYAELPDAPKLEAYADYNEYLADLSVFIADTRAEERDQARQQQETETARERTHAQRREAFDRSVSTFAERATAELPPEIMALAGAAAGGDQAITREQLDGLDPQLFRLTPTFLLAADQPITFGNLVADQLLASDHPVQLLRHLSDPTEAARLSKLDPPALLKEIGKIEAGFTAGGEKPGPAAPKLITDAPRPATTLGTRPAVPTDPIDAALASGDQAAFKSARLAARAALHGR
jgi:hypothetical protein